MAPFTNPVRSDGLVLQHWQKKRAPVKIPPGEAGEEDGVDKKEENAQAKAEEEYSFAKFNIKAKHPRRYTDAEYDRLLKNDIWSRGETDYLMDMAEEYDTRWIVIADRYDYSPKDKPADDNQSTALVTPTKRRSMEEMKSRYYNVAAHMLAIEHPPSEMSEAEFELYEKMMKFNPERERMRKELASTQLNRSREEVNEETLLLEELKRIVANEQQLSDERKELYTRLEAPISSGNTAVYQSSQGLSQLLQSLLQADKNKKRRPLLGPETGTSTPDSQQPNASSNARESRQETRSATPAASQQQGNGRKSTSNAAAAAAAAAATTQPSAKTLSPAEEAKYGVRHHDRLTSGVQFRNDKAQKLTQAKSNVQSQKLAAALTELEIPPRLFMPTEKVCKEFEKLIHSVNLLLDARKFSEKVEGEIRVLEASKEDREKREREEAAESGATATDGAGAGDKTRPEATGVDKEDPKVKREDTEAAAEVRTSGDAASTAANSPRRPSNVASHKRSASVLSAVSDKTPKKQKK